MQHHQETVHTTLNLSKSLIREAQRLFKQKSKTQIIHEALRYLVMTKKMENHLIKWQGKGSFKNYE